MRRRAIELKLHLGDARAEFDRTLVQNIVKAQKWIAMKIEGKTFPNSQNPRVYQNAAFRM